MKKLSLPAVLLALLLAGLAGLAQAGALVPAHVSADAKWVGHVNFEALRASELVQACMEKWLKKDECQAKIEEMSKKLGMNPMKDLLAATMYDTAYGSHKGVAIVYVKNADQKKLIGLLKEKCPDVQTAKHGERTLYTWTAKHRHHGEHKISGCFADAGTMVFSSDPHKVQAALEVIDGKKDGLCSESPLTQGVSKATLFMASAMDVDPDYQKETRCPVLKKCTAASVQWAERKGKLTGKYVLEANCEDTAQQIGTIVAGLKAMAALRFGSDETVSDLLDGVKSKVKGTTFTLSVKVSTDDVLEAARKCMKRYKARWEHHKKSADKHEGKKS